MLENLTGMVSDIFAGQPGSPLPLRVVSVPFNWLTWDMGGAGVQEKAGFYLGGEEQERLSSFRYEKRKIEWLAGRIAAKCAALQLMYNAENTSWPVEQWQQLQIAADSTGKPFVVSRAAQPHALPAISISHSKGLAAAMAARHHCGVDIQQITAAIERVAERFVAPGEKDILAPVAESFGRRAALTLLWSAKEAVKKAVAGPILPGFQQISLTAHHRSGDGLLFAVKIEDRSDGRDRQQFVWLRLLDGFSFAVTMQDAAFFGKIR